MEAPVLNDIPIWQRRIELDLSQAIVVENELIHGVSQFSLFIPTNTGPLGFVWGIGTGGQKNKFEIHGSYVLPWARRNGVRTALNRHLLKKNAVLITDMGSAEGEAFMQAFGYTYNEEMDKWVYIRAEGEEDAGS
jgi:hypothetical protein